ncbi:MAG TPA: hypothetical protein VD906_16910 [Caulobacteraceae bacterium]|nr:hypothetical protein [Caulobacteraceae bacterium]
MTDGIGNGVGEATPEATAAGRARMRGHVTLGERMWGRIRREYAAGASAGWLSARYGAGERTIGARAKKEGWRRKDLAEAADAELEAAEARGALDPAPPPMIGAVWDAATGRAEAAAFEAALAEVTDETRAGAAREALDRAVACMRRGDAPAATAYVRLAGALEALARTGAGEGVGEGEGGGDPTGPGREAALAFLRREGALG